MIGLEKREEEKTGVVRTGVDGKRDIERGVVGTASGSTFVRRNPPLQWGQKTEGGSPSCSRLVFSSLQGYGV